MTAALEGAPVQIGQTLYEPSRRRGGEYIEHKVASIGRKWVTFFGGGRCTIDGLMLDCSPYGMRQLYADKEAHALAARRDAAWRDLKGDLSLAKMPDDLTIADINAMRAKLGLQVLEATHAA